MISRYLISGLSIIALFLVSCGGNSGNPVEFVRAFSNLSFNRPIAMVQPPGNPSVWYLIQKEGRVLTFDNVDAAATTSLAIDMSDQVDDSGEGGLLDIAFHPSFSGSGDVFLSYTKSGYDSTTPLVSVVSRFNVGSNGLIASASESIIFTVGQPEDNHNGGDIEFGPDGYLYIALGDGGGGGDPYGNGQDTATLHGALLRVDVNSGAPYVIPSGNIFAGSATDAPEIYAWGFRNPWRFSFDEVTDDLWTGDVGQQSWEEIDLVIPGGNYGWNIEEGAHCYPPGSICDDIGLIDPVYEYGRSEGRSVTGGYVYRGALMPEYYGHYLFADWATGRLWGFDIASVSPDAVLLADTDLSPVSFAQDENLEIYVIDYFGGGIYRLDKAD